MFSIRKVKTKSGLFAVQVVRYLGHRSSICKHLGSAKDETELVVLRLAATDWILKTRHNYLCFPCRKKKY